MTPMTPTPKNVQIGWKVVQTQEVVEQGPNLKFIQGHRITAALTDGTTFSVFVPNAQYNPTTVKAMLSAQAQTVAAVQGLSG